MKFSFSATYALSVALTCSVGVCQAIEQAPLEADFLQFLVDSEAIIDEAELWDQMYQQLESLPAEAGNDLAPKQDAAVLRQKYQHAEEQEYVREVDQHE